MIDGRGAGIGWEPDAHELLRLAAHELRGPLTVAFTRLQIALRECETGSARAPLEQALDSLRRLGRTIDNLDGLGRSDGRPAEWVPVGELLRALAGDASLVSSREVEVECEEGARIHVRRALLEQALGNLVANAIKYSDPPAPIRLRAAREGAEWRIEVEDRGIGVEPADASRLTEPEVRGRNVGERQGLGLGLYVAKTLVAGLGGRLSIRSELGKGSVFTIHLPDGR